MGHAEHDYEKAEPHWPNEETVINRAKARLDEKLRHIAETEERMNRNAGHPSEPA